MAERPRLKKTDEILGSIVTEPAQGKRAGSRASDKNGEKARGEQKTKSVDDDFLEEEIELTDGPILPSAQSLAEKLLPKKAPAKRDFSAYEPPAPPRPQTASPARPEPKPPAAEPAQVKIEFDHNPALAATAAPAPVEFQAAAAEPAAIEFGTDDHSNPAQNSRAPAPRQGRSTPEAQRPAPQPVQEFEAVPTVSEYTFQSFEEPKAAEDPSSVWEFSAQGAEEPRRERRGRKPEDPQGPYQQTQQQPQQQAQPEQQSRPRRERIIQPLRTESPAIADYEHRPAPQQAAFSFEPEQPQQQTQQQQTPPRPQAPQPQVPPPPPPQIQSQPQPQPQPRPEQAPPPEPELSEAERNRQEFLKRIASQFEVQFEEKFEDGALSPRENISRNEPAPVRERPSPQPREPLFAPGPRPQARPVAEAPVSQDGQIDGEDFLSYVQRQERERLQREAGAADMQAPPLPTPKPPTAESADEPALGFIEKFEKDIREEEQQRSEDFKETLSQKFMRERERYLKELGIEEIEDKEPDSPPLMPEPGLASPPVASPRRKLDFQIQPEMHMQSGETLPNPRPSSGMSVRPSGPVTYNRGGAARPQTPADDEIVGGGIASAPIAAAGGKKTGEQLLLEHSMRARVPAAPKPQPAKLKFTFETPEEHAQKAKGEKESLLPAEKWPRRIIFIAMAAGLFALGLVIWSMVSYYNLSSGLITGDALSSPESAPVVEGRLDVYNDRVFTQTATVDNVFFKYAGTLLKNVNVKEHVVIEDVEGTGMIRLEDVSVDSVISVKSSGVDALELHNVKAARLIINNPESDVTVSATGNTNIDIVELRTKSTIKQSDINADFPGFGGMIITAAEQSGEINASLDGLNLRTLETTAATAVLSFANNTRAETVSADGSLSLSGSGKITNLSIGSKTGQGAGDFEDRKDVTLFVKDVSISNLNVKSPAYLNLSTTVDSISTADTVTIGGEASIGSLTLNPKAGSSSRLLIDIVAANIQFVYSNTQSHVNVTGASRINELTADASTYIMGNKVNHLRVNADGVIYENRPDNTTVGVGVNPPQSKAENPNINFDSVTPQQNTTGTVTEDFATTCGHSRESGGFLLGDGSKDTPYEISTAMQLAHVSSHLASHFIQTADIDIASESSLASNFPVIGGADSAFEGLFDGKGFAIANLKILSQAENIGLFGANRGTIQNVRVYSGDISSASASPGFVGGITGFNLEGGQIRSCSNGASVNGNQNVTAGGIAGASLGGRIRDCYNYAKVSGVNTVGGIIGLNSQGSSVTGSYNAAPVDGLDEVGSVAGKNEDGTIANCYYLANTSGFGIGSGGGTATEKTAEELASAQMSADLSAGNENSLWIPGSSTGSYRYPVHRQPE